MDEDEGDDEDEDDDEDDEDDEDDDEERAEAGKGGIWWYGEAPGSRWGELEVGISDSVDRRGTEPKKSLRFFEDSVSELAASLERFIEYQYVVNDR